jgi:hypothetical protein
MGATYSREDVMQALVAALRYGDDIGIAAMHGSTGRGDFDLTGISYLHPGAGILVCMSQAAADLLLDAHITNWNMPPNELSGYGREQCNLITFNHREVINHDDQEPAQED